MPDWLLVGVGAVLVLGLCVEAFLTTLAVSAGAGPITQRLLTLLWRGLLRWRRVSPGLRLPHTAGPWLLVLTVLAWVTWLWAGWTLVFAGSDAVVHARDGRPAGTVDTVYFTGMILFTLGTGDVVAATPGWRVVSAVAGFNGLFLVTLTITYLISVVSAVVVRRALAIQVRALGRSPAEIVTNGWTGDSFSPMFEQQLVGLTSLVATSAEHHLAYPVLHYFHPRDTTLAAAPVLAELEDALLVLSAGVAADHRPDRSAVEPLRSALGRYLSTATDTSFSPEVEAPPPPDLTPLADAGIPMATAEHFSAALARDRERRTTLHGLVAGAGWRWPT